MRQNNSSVVALVLKSELKDCSKGVKTCKAKVRHPTNGVKEGTCNLPSCDLRGHSLPLPNSVIFLEIKVYKNHYSFVKGYFRFKELLRNRYFSRYRVLKLRCLLDYMIISKFVIEIHARKEPS